MRIIEDSYYEHKHYGKVKVLDVTNGVVTFEEYEVADYISDYSILNTSQQSAAGFQQHAEPADVSLKAKPAVFNLTGV